MMRTRSFWRRRWIKSFLALSLGSSSLPLASTFRSNNRVLSPWRVDRDLHRGRCGAAAGARAIHPPSNLRQSLKAKSATEAEEDEEDEEEAKAGEVDEDVDTEDSIRALFAPLNSTATSGTNRTSASTLDRSQEVAEAENPTRQDLRSDVKNLAKPAVDSTARQRRGIWPFRRAVRMADAEAPAPKSAKGVKPRQPSGLRSFLVQLATFVLVLFVVSPSLQTPEAQSLFQKYYPPSRYLDRTPTGPPEHSARMNDPETADRTDEYLRESEGVPEPTESSSTLPTPERTTLQLVAPRRLQLQDPLEPPKGASSLEERRLSTISFVTEAVQMVGKAVVRIDTETHMLSPDVGSLGSSPLPPGPSFVQQGQGSGLILTSDGYVLTNAHVVEDATKVTVTLTDGRVYTAQVMGVDEIVDIAVLKIVRDEISDSADPLPVAELGDSDALNVGQLVIAVGSPGGLDNTGTLGENRRTRCLLAVCRPPPYSQSIFAHPPKMFVYSYDGHNQRT
jgi:small nuclear ribonucleoprotein (snRNP)-like protein